MSLEQGSLDFAQELHKGIATAKVKRFEFENETI